MGFCEYKSHSGGREFKSPLLHQNLKGANLYRSAPFSLEQMSFPRGISLRFFTAEQDENKYLPRLLVDSSRLEYIEHSIPEDVNPDFYCKSAP